MKKLLSLLLAVILVLALTAPAMAVDMGVVQIGGPEEEVPETAVEFTPHDAGDSTEIKLNETIDIPDWGEITVTKVDVFDSYRLYYKKGWSDEYESGVEADFVILYLDIVNTGLVPHDYLAEAPAYSMPVVRVVYKDAYEYEGKAFQVNQDWNSDGLIGMESDLNYPIKPMYVGHYMFLCKLPNAVIERKDSLRMTFIIDENSFTYTVRK